MKILQTKTSNLKLQELYKILQLHFSIKLIKLQEIPTTNKVITGLKSVCLEILMMKIINNLNQFKELMPDSIMIMLIHQLKNINLMNLIVNQIEIKSTIKMKV